MIVLFVLFWLLVGLATTIPEAKDIMRIANIGDRVICYLIFAAAGPVLLIAGFFSQILEALMPDDWHDDRDL